jgi:Tol biopolymer transport system component
LPPDGRYLLFDVVRDKAVSLWAYSAPDKKIHEVPIGYSTVPTTAVFSPDGHWVAYTTQESNMANAQVYVQPFPATGAKYLVSDPNDDGHHAAWSRDGRELFYTPGPGNRIQTVVISMTPSFQYSRPETIPRGFTNTAPSSQRMYAVGRDGRFLALIEGGALKESGVPTSQVVVVLNRFEELKRLVHTK